MKFSSTCCFLKFKTGVTSLLVSTKENYLCIIGVWISSLKCKSATVQEMLNPLAGHLLWLGTRTIMLCPFREGGKLPKICNADLEIKSEAT